MEVAEVAACRGFSNTSGPGDHTGNSTGLAKLLDDVVGVVGRFVSLRQDRKYAEAIALWVVGTHFFGWSNTFPRLVVTSPEPNCGKSTLMKLMGLLCPDAVLLSRATEAAILRRIKRADGKIVVLLDEAENFVDGTHTSLLNAGFDRYGGSFLRCRKSKGNYEDEEFNVYV